ncbi:MAG TPA: ribulose-phosphate 3-epimerase [Armatimonadaceae bacterium]|nr:ribulose-phosphate 3-epimerase [Armatimonadaceae bacterium]
MTIPAPLSRPGSDDNSTPDMNPLPAGEVRLSPSLLSADFGRFAEGAAACVHGGADWLHFDVMDGHFVPNITFGPDLVRALRPLFPGTPFDVHLMVEKPYDFIELFAAAGADLITVHAEATPHLQRTLAAIRALGRKAGVALNPATPPDVLSYVLDDLDLVLVMTVNPGFGGQKFLPAVADKVADLARLRDGEGASFLISVDGGVDESTTTGLVHGGADVLVAGSFVFHAPGGPPGGIAALRAAAAASL